MAFYEVKFNNYLIIDQAGMETLLPLFYRNLSSSRSAVLTNLIKSDHKFISPTWSKTIRYLQNAVFAVLSINIYKSHKFVKMFCLLTSCQMLRYGWVNSHLIRTFSGYFKVSDGLIWIQTNWKRIWLGTTFWPTALSRAFIPPGTYERK